MNKESIKEIVHNQELPYILVEDIDVVAGSIIKQLFKQKQ